MPSQSPPTALSAMLKRRFLLTGWPWRSLGYAVSSVLVALGTTLALAVVFSPLIVLVGRIVTGSERIPLLQVLAHVLLGAVLIAAAALWLAPLLAALERRRLALVDTRPVRSGALRPDEQGLWPGLRTRATDPATWRSFGYALLLGTVGLLLYGAITLAVVLHLVMLASPYLLRQDAGEVSMGSVSIATHEQAVPYAVAAALLLPLLPYLVTTIAGLHGVVARAMLHEGAHEDLHGRLVEVAQSRARLVDAFEAERRRIERDLHDGAQAQLLNLTLKLGVARLDLPPGSAAASTVAEAHEQAKELMTELRQIIRGIHPRVLTDRGLTAALWALTDESPIPVTVHADLPERLPQHIEVTAYFTAIEALNNIAKHAEATRADIVVELRGGVLSVEIEDDGKGGARPAEGSGLTGLADRVSAVDGKLLLSSPAGGPTRIRVELPCQQI